jgi:hypothetical protein
MDGLWILRSRRKQPLQCFIGKLLTLFENFFQHEAKSLTGREGALQLCFQVRGLFVAERFE